MGIFDKLYGEFVDIIEWLESTQDLSQYLEPMQRYRDRYGV